MRVPFENDTIAAAYAAMPENSRAMALRLRDLIYETAREMPQIGELSETLKWGQPSYTVKGGTPLRIAVPKTGGCGLYAHCQTTVIADYAAVHGTDEQIEGNRAVIFAQADDIVQDRLRHLIRNALTYHGS
ncbi:DUF1801 domain-containing protein [Yoonia sp. 208BN28-4]|uniref:DUF1801 domain-containing protein n=1 Tax=Yoonia sp. 208BN28-4 TaxID=3126505 RepID=UPI0030B7BF72